MKRRPKGMLGGEVSGTGRKEEKIRGQGGFVWH
jgi:hypothetical protein